MDSREDRAPTRAALIVAAHQYEDPRFQRLRSPVQDVEELTAVLGDPAVGAFDVRTVINEPGAVIQEELEAFFSDRRPDDLVLLYFSCHGVRDPAGRLYFVTSNTKFDLLRSTGVSASFVSEQMEYSRSKRMVVMLDCCYSGAFLKGFRARGDETVPVDQLEGRGRAVITASRATEYAFEADELAAEHARPSVFTGAIVEGLRSGRADRDGDGTVTVDELYDYVYDEVRGKVAGQTPGRWVDVEGDLVVARNPRPPVRAAALPSELQTAVDSDVALQRLGAVSALTHWCEQGDPGRRLAGERVLKQLATDYDARVRSSAQHALDALRTPPAVAVTPPSPAVEAVGPIAPTPTSSPPPPPPLPPAPAPSTTGSPTTATATATVRAERRPVAAWLALGGGAALFVAPFGSYIRYDWGSERLADTEWYALGVAAVFVLAAYAALCLLGTTGSPRTGRAILWGLVPALVAHALSHLSTLTTDPTVVSPGVGWVLNEAGAIALLAAAVLAPRRWRDVTLESPVHAAALRHPAGAAAAAAVAVGPLVGAAAALGAAGVFGVGGGELLDAGRPARTLVVRLLLLAVVACLVVRWSRAQPPPRRAVAIGVTAGVLVPAVALYVDDEATWSSSTPVLTILAYAAFVVGSVAVGLLAAFLVARRAGAIVLASWAGGSAAFLAPAVADTGERGVVVPLLVGGIVAALLAAATAIRRPDADPPPGGHGAAPDG